MKIRTLRGQLTSSGGKASKQLILNDQLINSGFKITGFFVWPVESTGSLNYSFSAILSYAELGNATVEMDAGDNTQIGWCYQTVRAQTSSAPPVIDTPAAGFGPAPHGFIDPDHIINRDLFVSIREADADRTYNYMVVGHHVELSDNEAIITIIKENSQSVE